MIVTYEKQGHVTDGLLDQLKRVPDSYDALVEFARRIDHLPLRKAWKYVEPSELDEIRRECDPRRPHGILPGLRREGLDARIEHAFLCSVAGCILGKPLEIDPTLDELKACGEAIGEWPIQNYISQAFIDKLGKSHNSAVETVREKIRYVAPDDDLNYTTLGMLLIEEKGSAFTRTDVMQKWLHNLPICWTWGPERLELLKAGLHSLETWDMKQNDAWADEWNPESEACGAAIRVDAYGFACPGNPALAAELAWRDAGFTHRATGLYSAMFVAAAIAAAPAVESRVDIFRIALEFVPRRSRFYEITEIGRAHV
jgi:ADP-ribosylglycohydrolase